MRPAYNAGVTRALGSLGLEKTALWPELLSRGFKDVPKTPRVYMKHRTGAETLAKEEELRRIGEDYIAKPLSGAVMPWAEKNLSDVHIPTFKKWILSGIKMTAEDPVTAAVAAAAPGGIPYYLSGGVAATKRGLTKKLVEKYPH